MVQNVKCEILSHHRTIYWHRIGRPWQFVRILASPRQWRIFCRTTLQCWSIMSKIPTKWKVSGSVRKRYRSRIADTRVWSLKIYRLWNSSQWLSFRTNPIKFGRRLGRLGTGKPILSKSTGLILNLNGPLGWTPHTESQFWNWNMGFLNARSFWTETKYICAQVAWERHGLPTSGVTINTTNLIFTWTSLTRAHSWSPGFLHRKFFLC